MATRRVDDSDEGEATALDLRPSSRSARPPGDGPSQPRAPAPPKTPAPAPAAAAPPSRRPILADSSEEDEDATEFLSVRPPSRGPAPRPSSTEAVPRAQGRAVPIEATPPAPAPPAPAPSPLPAAVASPLPSPTSPDSIRPLPQRTIASDASATGTASVPRVTRIHLVAKNSTTNGDEDEVPESTANEIDVDSTIPPHLVVKAPPPPPAPPRVPTRVESRDDETQAGDDPDETQAPSQQQQQAAEPAPPPHRRLPTSAEGDAVPARRAPARAEVHDGVLVVDAPAEATVTVNGIERGRGMVRVGDLDREARHAVRIHCAGYAPWSGSVSLQGKPAAKIRPSLKPRAR